MVIKTNKVHKFKKIYILSLEIQIILFLAKFEIALIKNFEFREMNGLVI